MRITDLRIPEPTVTVWMCAFAGGRVVGSPRRMHLYDVRRGLPPPLDPQDRNNNWNRRYWHPYRNDNTDARRPLCGVLKTTTRRNLHVNTYWYTIAKCEDCLAIQAARDMHYDTGLNNIQNTDPWYAVRNAGGTLIDPISGL